MINFLTDVINLPALYTENSNPGNFSQVAYAKIRYSRFHLSRILAGIPRYSELLHCIKK